MNQIPTITQVKQALHKLAEQKNRPYYELCTAKEVKYALENGLEHPLIIDLPFDDFKPREEDKPLRPCGTRQYPEPRQRKEMEDLLKSYEGKREYLAELAECTPGNIGHIIAGRINCTLEMYNKLMNARRKLEVMS